MTKTTAERTLQQQKSEHNKFVNLINNTPNFDVKFEALQQNPSIAGFNKLFGKNVKSISSMKGALRRMKNGVEKHGSNIVKMAFKNNDVENSAKVIANKIEVENKKFSNDKFKKRVKSLITKQQVKDKKTGKIKVKVNTVKEAITKANLISKGKGVGTHSVKTPVKSKTKKTTKKTKKKKPKKYRTKSITIGYEELQQSNEVYEE